MVVGRDLSKQEYWLDVIQRWQESGLGQAEFCRNESICSKKLYAWRRSLTKRRLIKSTAASRVVKKSSEVTKTQAYFAPVEIKPKVDVKGVSLERLEIVTPGGYVVRIS